MTYKGRVTHNKIYPIANASITLHGDLTVGKPSPHVLTDAEGYYLIDIPDGIGVRAEAFGVPGDIVPSSFPPPPDYNLPPIDLDLDLSFRDDAGKPVMDATADTRLTIQLASSKLSQSGLKPVQWIVRPKPSLERATDMRLEIFVPRGVPNLQVDAFLTADTKVSSANASTSYSQGIPVWPGAVQNVTGNVGVAGPVSVRLQRTTSDPTLDQSLWVAIEDRTHAISFNRYREFMNRALNWEERRFEVPQGLRDAGAQARIQSNLKDLGTDLHGVRAYQALKALTETFLLMECGVRIDPSRSRHDRAFDSGAEVAKLGQPFTLQMIEDRLRDYLGERAQLPYITRVVRQAFPEVESDAWSNRLIGAQINEPCLIELIWSYWMEEGMLVQTMNAISQRFQNIRGAGDRDVLQGLEIDPLRPLNNLLWGFIQDEINRLTVRRRAYEYISQYGLTLYGKATAGLRPADSRSKFMEAFHNLLHLSSVFFKDDYQTTVIADGFPLLNALKEVHLILAQGLQNQANDLPFTARAEMLLMQYMLGRRETRDFLQSRAMVPYKEPWEAQVDTMKSLQGWNDVTVSHFRDLAVYGEQILLSIRYGDWIAVNDEDSPKNWARFHRNILTTYIFSYRAVTGIDLTNADSVNAAVPGILLQNRMAGQQRAR